MGRTRRDVEQPTCGRITHRTGTNHVTNATGQYYEFDLTAFIQAERTAGRTSVAFRLINQQPTGNSGTSFITINSKEAASDSPQLVLTTSAPTSPQKVTCEKAVPKHPIVVVAVRYFGARSAFALL
jgi:hypothetical protein